MNTEEILEQMSTTPEENTHEHALEMIEWWMNELAIGEARGVGFGIEWWCNKGTVTKTITQSVAEWRHALRNVREIGQVSDEEIAEISRKLFSGKTADDFIALASKH